MRCASFVSHLLLSQVLWWMAAEPSLGADLVNSARVLIVGVEHYPQATKLAPLPGANREAQELKRLLMDLKVPAERVILLTSDHADASWRPTRANILHYVNWINSVTGPGELLLVLFTGHGVGTRDASFLCPMDTTDESLAAPSDETLLSVNRLAQHMSQSQAERRLLVVDACRNMATASSFVSGLKRPASGVWIMSSCSQGQVSAMDARPGQAPASIFWSSLADGLRGTADLLGNNNGSVGLFELYSTAYARTRERAEALGVQQSPELFGGLASPFEVLAIASHVRAPQLFSSDMDLEQRQTAEVLADLGVAHVRRGEANFRYWYSQAASQGTTLADWVYTDHHQMMSYALTHYLEPALAVKPDCRLGCLGQGWVYRSCGMYLEALAAYQRAGERLEVFVKGDRRGRDAYLELDQQTGSYQVFGRTERGVELTEVILRAEPRDGAEPVARAKAHSKLHVEQIQGMDPARQWLLVTHVNDNRLERAGWLPRSAVHWFAEAADVYTPAAPLAGGGGGVGGGLARFDEAAAGLESIAESLDAPGQALDNLAAGVSNSAPARIAGFFGFSIPGIGYLNTASSYARIPGSYLRTAAGYARMPANYYNTAQRWAGVTNSYFAGQDRALATEGRRLQLGMSEPVGRHDIDLVNAPWDF